MFSKLTQHTGWAVLATLVFASGVAQAQRTTSSSDDAPKAGYIRRFEVGATLGVWVLPSIPARSTDASNGSLYYSYSTSNASKRMGFGLTAQVAITEHFAFAASALYRRVGFVYTTSTTTSTTSSTGATSSTTVGTREDTRATAFEIPATVRYFVKGRHRKGPDVFFEGGATLLKAAGVRSSVADINNAGALACCRSVAADIAKRNAIGYVGGLGVHLVDPVGIRVIPEVRYTRWKDEMFHNQSTVTQRNQVEAVISLSF